MPIPVPGKDDQHKVTLTSNRRKMKSIITGVMVGCLHDNFLLGPLIYNGTINPFLPRVLLKNVIYGCYPFDYCFPRNIFAEELPHQSFGCYMHKGDEGGHQKNRSQCVISLMFYYKGLESPESGSTMSANYR